MSASIGTIQRAIELAKSGDFRGVTEIRARLKLERFPNVEMHLSGAAIKKQLTELMKAARSEREA